MIDGSSIEVNIKEVLLRITIYRELKFDDHFNKLCKNLNAFARLATLIKVNKRRIVLKPFMEF